MNDLNDHLTSNEQSIAWIWVSISKFHCYQHESTTVSFNSKVKTQNIEIGGDSYTCVESPRHKEYAKEPTQVKI